jgi:hypothetical protein
MLLLPSPLPPPFGTELLACFDRWLTGIPVVACWSLGSRPRGQLCLWSGRNSPVRVSFLWIFTLVGVVGEAGIWMIGEEQSQKVDLISRLQDCHLVCIYGIVTVSMSCCEVHSCSYCCAIFEDANLQPGYNLAS